MNNYLNKVHYIILYKLLYALQINYLTRSTVVDVDEVDDVTG